MAEETKEEKTAEERRADENVIYVGNKPPMSYVLAIVTQFQGSGSDEVVIKARGRAISRAVDAAEITRNRFVTNAEIKEIKIGTESVFVTNAEIKEIKIGTESVTNEEGRTSNVSSIEIILTTKKKSK
jgi:DNA-binding protein